MPTYDLADKSETFIKLTNAIRDQINAIDPNFQVTNGNTWYTLIRSQHESGWIGYQLGYKEKGGDICTAVIHALNTLRYRQLPDFNDAFCRKLLNLMTKEDVAVHKGSPITVASAESQALFNDKVVDFRDQGLDI